MNLARREGAPLVRFRQEMARASSGRRTWWPDAPVPPGAAVPGVVPAGVGVRRRGLHLRRSLLRLSTPAGEPISPAEFIPLAEENGSSTS